MARNNTSMNIILGVVNTGLYKGLSAASARVSKFAVKMKAVGATITSSFTMPFALVAGASVKMAMDFEKSMTKIQTLVLGSGQDMDAYAQSVKNISSVTAVAATETAEGLYFLTSAGLRGVNALETLTTVNKGVAIGLGESTDLAKVAAAAQNAYGSEVITATAAIDKFGMAVRTGMFESSELAESLGTQVGMAAELGISFDELLANISTYTKTTGDARSATTGFGGVMMAFAKETGKGKTALDQVNMSYDGLRSMLQDQGLQATLFQMKDAFAANGVEMTEFFGKSQAVKNIMGVLGTQAENYKTILDDMSTSAGFTADAFDVLSSTPGFQIEKSLNQIKLSFQEIGDIIMPTISGLINGISNVIGWFGKLETGTKNWALAIAGVLAFAGPLISFFGFLAGVIGFIMSPIGLIIAGLALLGAAIYKNWDLVKKWIAAFVNYFIDLYNESLIFRAGIEYIMMTFKNLWATVKFVFNSMKGIVTTLINTWIGQFKAVAKVISSALKLDPKGVKEGAKEFGKATVDGYKEIGKVLKKEATILGDEIAENMNTAISNTLDGTRVEYISEDDIQNGVDAMGSMAQKGFDKMKAFFEGGGSALDFSNMFPDDPGDPNGGGDPKGGDPKGGGGDVTAMEKQKSAMRQMLEGMSSGWKTYFANQDAAWSSWGEKTAGVMSEVGAFASDIGGQINAIAQQRHANEMQMLDNEYNSSIQNLENRGLSEKEFASEKERIDKSYQTKKKALEIKAAKREKKMAIFQAIINTAAGIAKAIPNPYLMAFAGIMGAAQVAAISSAPIPMAKGALAYSPTNAIVGDNPNAMNDPEVIAPLSKLSQIMGKQNSTVEVVGSISGNDVVLSSSKANISLARYA